MYSDLDILLYSSLTVPLSLHKNISNALSNEISCRSKQEIFI